MAIERGLDISYSQSPTSTTLLGLLAQPLYTFVICKATEGISTDDSKYVLHRANVAKYGKRHGAYHFAWPNQDPLLEAAHFVRVAALKPGEIACLDVENWGDGTQMAATPWAKRVAYALTWLREVKRLIPGVTPFIYMNWDWVKNFRTASSSAQWAELCTYPVWLADYDSNAPGVHPTVNPKVAGGVTLTVVLHQWTASRPANDGGLDGNALEDPAAWNRYAVPQEEMFTVGQYEDIMAAVAAVKADVATLTNKVDQKANGVDVKANSTALANLSSTVTTAHADDVAHFTDLAGRIDGIGDAVAEQVSAATIQALDDSLGGVEISTTARYVRQKEAGS